MKQKTAIITGITGQDGAYLAKFLADKNYTKIIGVTRAKVAETLPGLDFLGISNKIEIKQCDLTNYLETFKLIKTHCPSEVYNLAAQSSVGLSFENPDLTFTFNTLSVMNLLESIRKIDKSIRFYQASSSEMFGNVSYKNLPIKETLLFHPVSPYGISKASAHWLTVNYREAYGLFASCGILFNHESALRKDTFVIKKIIATALEITRGNCDTLTLGNLAVNRDWGYAPKYVEAMWRMLNTDVPDDYIICSGNLNTLQEVVLKVFKYLDLDIGKHLRLDERFMRSLDLSITYGDNSKAKSRLEWEYEFSIDDLLIRLIEDEKSLMDFRSARSKKLK